MQLQLLAHDGRYQSWEYRLSEKGVFWARVAHMDKQVRMAGRERGASQNVPNDLLAQMVAALQQVNENLQNLNQNPTPSPSSQPLVPPGPTEYQGLDEFCTRNPSDVHKLTYASYMMTKEAENWWEMTSRQMEAQGTVVTWDAFKGKFFQKYFPADLRRKKEMEFLRLE
ncbi:hypothetical protein Lal_00021318 [Lupinus albus]|nr:hypothetical protein Lal_00021318 [Lupinus albus]